MYLTTALLPLLLATYVSAHGFVFKETIGGKSFNGNMPSGQRNPSIIRQITTTSPVKGVNNADINCGPGASIGSQVADANPGDTLTFDWRAGDNLAPWPHNTGPLITYLASCGSTTCDKFDSRNARWFKIDQKGRKPNSGEWFQGDLMQGGAVATAKLPNNLAPGNYLVRHEIIALHLATQRGGAEFYPSCSQIRVGGSGTGVPSANELVSFPGGYTEDHPGIFVPGVFSNNLDYQFPGPPIATLAGGAAPPATGGSGSGSGNSTNVPTTPTTTTNPTNNAPAETTKPAKGKVCKLKKSTSASAKPTGEVYPRHYSRIMRRIAHEQLSFN